MLMIFGISFQKLRIKLQHTIQIEGLQVQQVLRVHLAVLTLKDFCSLVHRFDSGLNFRKLLRFNQICLVQQHTVCEGHLFDRFVFDTLGLLLVQMLHDVFGVHHCDNAVKLVHALNVLIHEEGLCNRSRIGKACSFDDDCIKLGHLLVQSLQRLHQITSHSTANAPIHHLDDLFTGVLLLGNNLVVHTYRTKLILNDCKLQFVRLVRQDVIQQSRLPAAQKARQHSTWNNLSGWHDRPFTPHQRVSQRDY
mmetsp:Transcript_23637/g.53847  ORF Transcript_23637/g.53847 Transcript_23637/m.53847 type:complete len:250 (-) Transcript_23637:12-761(-)